MPQAITPYLLAEDGAAAVDSLEDPEGHEWFFAQHVRDVPPEEWGAEAGDPAGS